MAYFGKFGAAFAGERGNGAPDGVAHNCGSESDIGYENRLFDVFQNIFVPRLDADCRGVGRGYGGDVFEAGSRAVGFNHYVFDHGGRSFARMDGFKFVRYVRYGL